VWWQTPDMRSSIPRVRPFGDMVHAQRLSVRCATPGVSRPAPRMMPRGPSVPPCPPWVRVKGRAVRQAGMDVRQARPSVRARRRGV
jgi:hypothetical protein